MGPMRYIGDVFTVFIDGLDLYAYHGVPAEERVIGHRYLVDIKLRVQGAADQTDAVEDTIDYGAVADHATSVVQDNQFKTIEKLATVIGKSLLTTYPQIEHASVTVKKPLPPMPAISAAAGVTVELSRTS